MKQYTKAEVKKEDGAFVAVASTASEDRHGEIVSLNGWDLKNFKENPVILWGHNHDEPAIGKALKTWISKASGALMMKVKFHEHTEKARAVKALFEDGILNSFSVGFIPKEMEGETFVKQELIEVSAVNVPANPDARVLAYKTLKSKGFEKEVIDEFVDTEIIKLKERVSLLESKMQSVVKGLEGSAPQNRVQDVLDTKKALNKVIARASDKILEEKGRNAIDKAKVIKMASEKLSKQLKES